jgi:serine phosphatase RsbU (regulator of sigma subunit)
MLYLCSDGLTDQNNPERKKFGENTLRHLLSECHDKPTETQKTNLTDALDAHQQNTEQRDDITFLGIRLCWC